MEQIKLTSWRLSLYFGLALSGVVATATATEVRGFVVEAMVTGVLAFQRCNGNVQSQKTVALLDKTPDMALSNAVSELRQLMSNAADRAVYVEVKTVSDTQGVAATRLRRAVGHVESCAALPPPVASDARIYAEGNNPPWTFVQTAAGARFQIRGAKPIRFPATAFTASISERQTFDAWSPQDGGTIRLEITEQLCLDPAAEAAFGARVAVRVGSFSAEGCASRF